MHLQKNSKNISSHFYKLINFKKISFLFIFLIFFSGCGPSWNYSSFKSVDGSKSEEVFEKNLEMCLEEKEKYSSIIQGREYGFRGEHAPFLGCMRYKGWSPKKSFS